MSSTAYTGLYLMLFAIGIAFFGTAMHLVPLALLGISAGVAGGAAFGYGLTK